MAPKILLVKNIRWESNPFFRWSISNLFGIDVFFQRNKEKKRNIPMIHRKKKKVSPVEWRSWHRPCPLERLSFSQELFAQVSPLPLLLKDGKWDVCEKEP